MKPKVLIVTMYQHGLPGMPDSQGEATAWIEHRALQNQVAVPGTKYGLFTDHKEEIALLVTGVGKANAATSMVHTGLHEGIDLSETYILVCGIAGANPRHVSIGSPVWCDAVVDGDLASFVSMSELEGAREFPFFPMGTTGLKDEEAYTSGTEVYFLDQALVEQAYSLTCEVTLVDDAPSHIYRHRYRERPAILPPFVHKGAFLSSDTFVHGHLTGSWSEEWISLWTCSNSRYVLGNQEDSGTLTALRSLADMNRVQWNRILLLRAGSNYDRPAPGESALESLQLSISNGVPIAMDIALQNIFLVGNRFVEWALA